MSFHSVESLWYFTECYFNLTLCRNNCKMKGTTGNFPAPVTQPQLPHTFWCIHHLNSFNFSSFFFNVQYMKVHFWENPSRTDHVQSTLSSARLSFYLLNRNHHFLLLKTYSVLYFAWLLWKQMSSPDNYYFDYGFSFGWLTLKSPNTA